MLFRSKLEEISYLGQTPKGTYEAPATPKVEPKAEPVEKGPAKLPEAKAGEAAMPIQRGSVAAVPMDLLTTPDALQRAGEVLRVPEKTPERILYELNKVASRGGLAEWEARKIIGEEKPSATETTEEKPDLTKPADKRADELIDDLFGGQPSVTETTETKQTKEERPAKPTEGAAPTELKPLELEAGRNEELEVEEENKTLLDIDEHLKKWYGTTATGEVRKRASGAGRPESETAKTEEQRNEESKAANQFNRDVLTLIKIANKYDNRQPIESFPTKDEWEAAEEVRANNLELVQQAIYGVSRQPGASKGIIAAKEYMRSLKPAAREAAQKAHEAGRKAPLKPMEAKSRSEYISEQQFDMEPDFGFYGVDTLTGALTLIVDSPNDVEALLAARLLQSDNIKSIENVPFIVVDKSTQLKDKSVKRMINKGTVGLFVPDTVGGNVYVRGDSYEEQGINNEIVLHEAMHASGSKKIAFALLAKQQGETINENLAEAVDELQSLMDRAKAAYDSKQGNVSPMLKFLHDQGDAFTDIQEFYAYGMTNPVMKDFLLHEVEGKIKKTSGFDDFVRVIMRLFGIDPNIQSGLKDLVLISHEIMRAKEPSGVKQIGRAHV